MYVHKSRTTQDGALDYFDVIQHPMDLGTIHGKLLAGESNSGDSPCIVNGAL